MGMRALFFGILFTLVVTPGVTAAELPLQTRSGTVDLAGLEAAFREVARTVAPSVVAISAVGQDDLPATEADGARLSGEQFDAILGRKPRVVGTGFVFEAGGYILTNQHVIDDAQRLWVTTDDGTVLPAMILGSDPRSDLAVLKVPADLPVAPLAPEDAERGQWCIALGNPVGLATSGEMAMSVGVVSAIDRDLPKLARDEDRLYEGLIQTTAEINPGNSGGPLFDLRGRVIGVVAAVVLPQKQTHGLSFALPVNASLRDKVDRLKRGLPIRYASFGLRVIDGRDGGAQVVEVAPDSPCGDALRPGDTLVQLGPNATPDAAAFVRRTNALTPGDPVMLTVRRDGETFDVQVLPKARDEHRLAAVTEATQRIVWRGVTFAPVPTHFAEQGVVALSVEPDSPMAETWQAGTVVTRWGDAPVTDLPSLQAALLTTDDSLRVTALDQD